MQKTLAAAALAAVLGAAGAASGADLSAGGSLKDTGSVPAPLWTGFYIGVNGGWAWGTETDVRTDVSEGELFGANSASHHSDGGFGGGQIGYNIQRDRLVFGLEADFQGAGVTGSKSVTATFVDDNDFITATGRSELDWFGTVRGRLGLTFPNPSGLIYITGGVAFGGVQHKLSATLFQEGGAFTDHASASSDSVEAGWVLGAGYERFITPALSAKVEYQYIDLGSENLAVRTLTTNENTAHASASFTDSFSTVRVGLNYHLVPGYEPLK